MLFFNNATSIPLSVDFFLFLDETENMGVKKTPEGFLTIKSRFARSGIQEYAASELRGWGVPMSDGVPDNAIVRVYRDKKDVFDEESMKSFENKPVTNRHPSGPVTPDNFTTQLAGLSLSPVVAAKDGKHLNVDVMLLTKEGIDAYKAGVKQLSAGYSSEIQLSGGLTTDGEPYDMKQTKIFGNHIALVPRGRAGTARLLDMRDGQEDDMADSKHDDAVELGKVRQQLNDSAAQLEAITKERDGLKGQVEALQAAQLTDEQLAEKVSSGVEKARETEKAREAVTKRAVKFAPSLKVSDSMSLSDIMKEAIRAKNPKADLEGSADYIRGIFDNMPEPKGKESITRDSHRSNTRTEIMPYDELNSVL